MALFKNKAWAYEKYRPKYPQSLISQIVKTTLPRERMADLGCGTGQIAIPMSQAFKNVDALDCEAEMLEVGQAVAQGKGNIHWHHVKAEDLLTLGKTYNLITIAKAFHWMEQERVLEVCHKALTPDGTLVIVAHPSANLAKDGWRADRPDWEAARLSVVKKWFGQERKTSQGAFKPGALDYAELLKHSAFKNCTIETARLSRDLDTQTAIEELFSMSYVGPLGEGNERFKEEVRTALLKENPKGIFTQTEEIALYIGKRTGNSPPPNRTLILLITNTLQRSTSFL